MVFIKSLQSPLPKLISSCDRKIFHGPKPARTRYTLLRSGPLQLKEPLLMEDSSLLKENFTNWWWDVTIQVLLLKWDVKSHLLLEDSTLLTKNSINQSCDVTSEKCSVREDSTLPKKNSIVLTFTYLRCRPSLIRFIFATERDLLHCKLMPVTKLAQTGPIAFD